MRQKRRRRIRLAKPLRFIACCAVFLTLAAGLAVWVSPRGSAGGAEPTTAGGSREAGMPETGLYAGQQNANQGGAQDVPEAGQQAWLAAEPPKEPAEGGLAGSLTGQAAGVEQPDMGVREGSEEAEAEAEAAAGEEADAGEEAETVEAAEAAPQEVLVYPVPATPPVNQSYFRDALFIGDSRVMGLMLYSGLTEATFYTEKGINVTNLLTNPIVMQTGGEKITIPEALKKKSFGKIYIKMGLNELGWKSVSLFVGIYGKVIDEIRELQPDAVFYVQSILPVTQKKSRQDDIFTNERILEFNEAIRRMAGEKGLHYLDVHGGLADDNGCLPDGAGLDGVHLNKEYSGLWLEFLKRHTVRDYAKVKL
ncbi:MAG: GDSL-type esterase/lipase family protein [Clostridiales bacterium]|nr:GDSL-type esterase/lipase family protein [Clostridiales bacterium]